eukprot:gb/GECG01000739.1/.p1 GENE.gb/GECG01000739.1/~~gb/GECG01000739.1/.p1  ORF type:complete len:743 (+),score=110.06 gb/GECG01000739.1/:1-2229(+)
MSCTATATMQSKHTSPSGSPSLKAIRSQQLAEKLSLEEESGGNATIGEHGNSGSSHMSAREHSLREKDAQSEVGSGRTLAQRLFGSQQQQDQEAGEDSDYLLAMKLQRFYDGQNRNQGQVCDDDSGSPVGDDSTVNRTDRVLNSNVASSEDQIGHVTCRDRSNETETDNDFAIALQIQEQEESGALYSRSQRLQPQGKVRLRTREDQWVNYGNEHRKPLSGEAEQEGQTFEPHDTDLQDWEDEREFQRLKGAQIHTVSAGGSTKTMTKHDSAICGRRNARDLEQQFPEMVGDLTFDSPRGGRLSAEGGGERLRIGTTVYNDLRRRLSKNRTLAKGHSGGHRVEREEFSTHEGAMDKRTRLLVFKLVNNGLIDRLHGCVKAGKEANIYFAEGWHPSVDAIDDGEATEDDASSSNNEEAAAGRHSASFVDAEDEEVGFDDEDEQCTKTHPETAVCVECPGGDHHEARTGEELYHIVPQPVTEMRSGEDAAVAVKIFRTTLNEFKNRKDYITGDRRFRHVNLKKESPRKIITIWAKKEFANLCRIYRAGIPCPEPLLARKHILLQSFIGVDGWPAPELHEVGRGKTNDPGKLSDKQWQKIYYQVARIICALYHRCRLVHADLSERNLLWYDKKVWVIDVAQAVQREHPRADEFLMRDIRNITNYFQRRTSIRVLPPERLYDFVKDPSVSTDKAVLHRYTKLADRQYLRQLPARSSHYALGSKEDPVVKQLKGMLLGEVTTPGDSG